MRVVHKSPTDFSFVQNPYPTYDGWRDAPFVFWHEYGLPVSAQFNVVNTILRDRRFGREAPVGFTPEIPEHVKPFYDFESRSMLEREPPTHTRLRGLVLRAFTSRRIQSLEDEITELADQLIDSFPTHDFDILPNFAAKLPVIIIARMIGIDDKHADKLLAWSHDMVAMYQANRSQKIEDNAVRATLEFSDFIRHIANARRTAPRDDLISALIAAEAEGDRLTIEELITTVILLLNAGHEATVHGIGNGLSQLLNNNINPLDHNMHHIIEEILRIDPPLHMFTRWAMHDVEVFGHKFKQGDQVGLLLGAANRDPAKFTNPDQFNPNRAAADHTSFGSGLHFCIGAPLARLEMRIAFTCLFARYTNLTLAKPPIYADRYHFHGLESLWITL